MINKVVVIVLFFLLGGCVEPYPVPTQKITPKLVVDGLITDEPGPHTVTLVMSATLTDDPFNFSYVGGAQLTIRDDLGTIIQLLESTPGIYKTTPGTWHATLGRSYSLKIVLTDGRAYESETQLLYPAGEIIHLTPQFMENSINHNDPAKPQDSFGMYMDAAGVDKSPNLYRWRWIGIYEVLSFPELHQKVISTPFGGTLAADPLPCSAVFAPDGLCTCCSCWVSEYSSVAKVSNNQFVSDNQFNSVFLDKIPVDRRRFYKKYHFEVQQVSLSESVYSFWKLVSAQQSGANNIFQPNAIKIRGNVNSTTNANEEVFGVVAFSSITRKSVELTQFDVPAKVQYIDSVKNDCRTLEKYSSNIKPPFW